MRWTAVNAILEQNALDYYSILGLQRSATMVQIKKAHRLLAIKIHPDKFEESERAHPDITKAFVMLNAAGEVLRNVNTKHIYDSSSTAEEFAHRMREFATQDVARAQNEAEDEARREATKAAQMAREAHAQAEKEAAEAEKEAAANGGMPREFWYRSPKSSSASAEKREYKPPPAFGTPRQNTKLRAEAQQRQNAKARAEAQATARNTNNTKEAEEADAYAAHLAVMASRVPAPSGGPFVPGGPPAPKSLTRGEYNNFKGGGIKRSTLSEFAQQKYGDPGRKTRTFAAQTSRANRSATAIKARLAT